MVCFDTRALVRNETTYMPAAKWFMVHLIQDGEIRNPLQIHSSRYQKTLSSIVMYKKAGNREECNRPDDGRSFDNGSQVDGSPHTIQAFHWVTGTKLGNLNGL